MHEDEAVGKVGLIADENQADIKLAVGGEAARVVEGAAVEQVFFHELRIARIGKAHMAVFGRDFTVGVFGEIGGVALFFTVHGCAAVFAPAENIGLFLHRGAVPKLDKVTDEADGLIAAVFRPCRFVQAVGGNTCPQDLIGDFGIFDFGIAGAVAET